MVYKIEVKIKIYIHTVTHMYTSLIEMCLSERLKLTNITDTGICPQLDTSDTSDHLTTKTTFVVQEDN